jgi:hypothetical protein
MRSAYPTAAEADETHADKPESAGARMDWAYLHRGDGVGPEAAAGSVVWAREHVRCLL